MWDLFWRGQESSTLQRGGEDRDLVRLRERRGKGSETERGREKTWLISEGYATERVQGGGKKVWKTAHHRRGEETIVSLPVVTIMSSGGPLK